jgi:uncharacterized protein VcgC/VcgE DUF2780
MTRTAGTLMLAVALNLVACSKATQEGGAASDLASPAGLTNMLTSKLGISESQASMALGALLGEAKGKLSPGDYSKLEGALPGAEHYLSAAEGAGVLPSTKDVAAAAPAPTAPGGKSDSTVAAIGDSAAAYAPPAPQVEDAATAAGAATGPSGLSSALAKVGLPPEAASQFVPVVTEYVGKVAGPDVANILKSAFPT